MRALPSSVCGNVPSPPEVLNASYSMPSSVKVS
ncbi:Uncharacterised protein [Bordetella pertussis]|nr:Uncharacterised protein [Bordetella pertussis]